jgi:hypothetical protein
MGSGEREIFLNWLPQLGGYNSEIYRVGFCPWELKGTCW